jgi:iron-sulfur cluster repair protein YtfE (RIC family)
MEETERRRTAIGQLGSSHRRHDERLEALVVTAAQLCGGNGGPQDLEDLEQLVRWFARSVPRHFGDEDAVVFPALAAARPELAGELGALSGEHEGLHAAHRAVHDAVLGWGGTEPAVDELPGFLARVKELAARYRDHAAREDLVVARLAASAEAEGDADVFDAEEDGRLLAAMDERRGR